jgi:hypothetical protein
MSRKVVSMSEYGFHNDGWYPHDGEGKINNCPGPGCDCDEKNYGYHHSSSGKGDLILVILAVLFGIICPPIGFIFALIFMFK